MGTLGFTNSDISGVRHAIPDAQNGTHQKMGYIFPDDNFPKFYVTFGKVIIRKYKSHLLMGTVFGVSGIA